MEFSTLEIFRTVADERSVTRAAKRLRRVPSNVTTRIRQLEENLGAPLFLRDGKRMTLTSAGETFLGYANRLLSLEAEARQAVNTVGPKGVFRVGTMESTAASRLPKPLADFHARWPAVSLELYMAASQELIEQVLDHTLACALIAWPPGAMDAAQLDSVPVFVEDLLLILPKAHPPIERAADLEVDTVAALEPGCTYRRLAEAWIANARTRTGRAVKILELTSYHSIFACVAAGSSVGVVPKSVLDLQRTPHDVRVHSLGEVETLLVRRKGYRSPAYDAFFSTLQEASLGETAALASG
jgi:DNA-binding transcriptional LysR family regulator